MHAHIINVRSLVATLEIKQHCGQNYRVNPEQT